MIKRIAIIGPESTGKSELCQHLARHYDTEWVPEYARFYIDRLDRNYEQHDLKSIAEGQLTWEDEKAEYSNNYLICDTNLIVIKIWSDHKYGETAPWIEEQLKQRIYDFYLLSNIDIPWRPDPQREHPNLRQHFFEVYKNYLEEHKLPYALVSGIEGERKKCAVDAIENFFSNKDDAGSSPA
ncbi:ATP-binding protein [Ekhidna sp. MALMAid0563]|uniref:ATP-binding protein n=1 Tax=Ekhidna sp. MALMAid0563 TaxID=3143937 RepID=UPI0032DF18C7